jgi:hypothetical protein
MADEDVGVSLKPVRAFGMPTIKGVEQTRALDEGEAIRETRRR